MLERMIRFAIAHRWLMLVLTLVLIAVGAWSFGKLPIDATPDITNVQVQVNTETPGYSPLEAEQRVTFPIESALAGLPRHAERHFAPGDRSIDNLDAIRTFRVAFQHDGCPRVEFCEMFRRGIAPGQDRVAGLAFPHRRRPKTPRAKP